MAVTLSLGPPLPQLEWPEGCKVGIQTRREIEADWQEAHAPQQQRSDELHLLRQRVEQLERQREDDRRRYRRLLFDVFGGKADAAAKAGCDVSDARDGIYLGELTPGLFDAIAELVKAERANISKRFDDLDKRVGAGMRFKGVHEAGSTYEAGDVCVRSGSSWIALTQTADVPGEGSTGWQMMAKRGRDSRDRAREPVLK